jgi:hypothetical protein
MPIQQQSYLTEREAATELKHSPATLARWRRARIGPPAVQVFGRRWIYSRSDLAEWVAAKTVTHPGHKVSRGRKGAA